MPGSARVLASPRAPEEAVHIGPFRLIVHERRLERGSANVPIGGRALDILIRLIAGAGQVVSKQALGEAAWPGLVVEDGSLRFHIAALRRILDEDAAQGYSLTAMVSRAPPRTLAPCVVPRLPPCPRHVVAAGRPLEEAARELSARRFLTLVGPAGIGKTTLALRLGHGLAADFAGDVAFVDLAAISDPAMVPQGIADAIGHKGPSVTAQGLQALLANRAMLLILDGCEHVIDVVAGLAERLVRALPDLVLLATSRESLRIEDEAVYRLLPLACPPPGAPLTAAHLLQYPAARLFVERVEAATIGYRLTEADVPFIADICHRLDGIPLALELAAGCVQSHGIRHAAQLLEGCFRLLWKGRRTAPARHQTLGAALDWSHDLLSPHERVVLRRIAVFAGGFSAAAAAHVAGDGSMGGETVLHIMSELMAKSLVIHQESAPGLYHYRLLDTTRLYALGKLAASGEEEQILARQADHARCAAR